MSELGEVRWERRGPAAVITIDRAAARNAMTWAMYEELARALARTDDDRDVRVAVLRGAGGCFVAGTDIAQLSELDSEEAGVAYERRLEEVVARLEAVRVPTLAVVERYAAGGGMVLAAACDLRICTHDTRFGVPIARTVGNCLSTANLARLVAHLGPGRVKAMLLAAHFMDAEEARGAGFVLDVVAPAELEARTAGLCARMAELAPVTLAATKDGLRRVLSPAAADGEDEALLRRVYGSVDFREGVLAFLEKRDPRWEGR